MEELLGFAHLAALQVTDLGGEAFDAAGDDGQRAEKGGVTVPRDDLGGDGFRGEAQSVGHVGFDAGIGVGVGANGAADRTGGDLRPGGEQAGAVAGELGVVAGELDAEGGGLGVYAVAAADGERVLVLDGAALEGGEQVVEIGQQDVGGLGELDGEAGVEHVAARHAEMDEAAVRADFFGEPGEKGDDVVAGLALDLVDAVDVGLGHRGEGRGAAFAYVSRGVRGISPRPAMASAARDSIWNQMR